MDAVVAFILVALFLTWQGDGDPIAGAEDVLSSIVRGARLTRAPYSKTDGLVHTSPEDLAAQAGLDQETYSLARAISSEEGNSDNATKAAVGWCIVNAAARRGQSVTELVLHAANPAHSGSYGTQEDLEYYHANGVHRSDRYCASGLDPYQGDADIASGILSGAIADLTGGCNQFDRPAGEAHPDQVAAKRIAAGAELVAVAGADAGLRFWRS